MASKRLSISANGTNYYYIDNQSDEEIADIKRIKVNCDQAADVDIYRNPAENTQGTEKEIQSASASEDYNEIVFRHGGDYSGSSPYMESLITSSRSANFSEGNIDDIPATISLGPGDSLAVRIQETSGNGGKTSFRAAIIER